MLWVLATLVAVVAQTARNAMQNRLTSQLGTLGATQVRFLYGLPFSLLFLVAAAAIAHAPIPAPQGNFLAAVSAGAVAQIGGTALLLAAMQARSFSVAIAFSKTEAVQIAIFGLVLLGDPLTPLRAAAILLATAGVFVTAVRPGEKWDTNSVLPALYGIASGGLYAIAAIGFRGAILALGDGDALVRASTTLVWSLAIQSALLGGWLWAFDRRALVGSFAVWKRSLTAGFAGALASQFWFIGFALTAAANVRTLGLVEVLFAQVVLRRVVRERVSAREIAGAALIVGGVGLLLLASPR